MNRWRPLWLAYQWKVVLLVGLVSIALIHFGVHKEGWWSLAAGQHTLEILGIARPIAQYDSDPARLGSFFFVAVALFTLWTTWRVVFDEQRQYSRLWRLADHTIVCGFGEKGRHVAEALASEERSRTPIVVIERQASHPGIVQRRRDGGLTLVGDARDPELLRLAGVERAQRLLVLGGDDETNAQIASRAAALCRTRHRGRLTCVVHLDDPVLYQLVREREVAGSTEPGFRLQCFNVYEAGARAILDAHPPVVSPDATPHVVLVGFGRLGQHLVLELARRWWFERGAKSGRLRVTVIDPDVTERIEKLEARHPRLRETIEIDAVAASVQSRAFESADLFPPSVDAVYVCLSEATSALTAALAIRPRLGGRRVPLVARVARPDGLACFVDDVGADDMRTPLRLFALVPATCGAAIVTRTTVELLARAYHAEYLRDATHGGAPTPSARPWDELSEDLRESNRGKADDVRRQLSSAGYELMPLSDWTEPSLALPPDDVEHLAVLEHERWVAERTRAGWRHGVARNETARTHPDLKAWGQLDEPTRDKDRNSARAMPALLARLGFRVVRRPG